MCKEVQEVRHRDPGRTGVSRMLPGPQSGLRAPSKEHQRPNFQRSLPRKGKMGRWGRGIGIEGGAPRRGCALLTHAPPPAPAHACASTPAPPLSPLTARQGRPGLRLQPRAAPDPGLWEAGSGNQEVTEEWSGGGAGHAQKAGLCNDPPTGRGLVARPSLDQ